MISTMYYTQQIQLLNHLVAVPLGLEVSNCFVLISKPIQILLFECFSTIGPPCLERCNVELCYLWLP
jgi:hypothetical protein